MVRLDFGIGNQSIISLSQFKYIVVIIANFTFYENIKTILNFFFGCCYVRKKECDFEIDNFNINSSFVDHIPENTSEKRKHKYSFS
jgi:hypothetical protein